MGELFAYKDTELKVLKNFAAINPNMIVLPDKFAVVNGMKKSVVGYYAFEETYDYEPYGIFDLDEFLTTISSMTEYKLNVCADDNYVEIHDVRNGLKAVYNTSPLDMLPEVKDLTSKFSKTHIDLEFVFTAEKLAILRKVTSVLKLERIYLESIDDGIRILAANKSLKNMTNPTELMLTGEHVVKNELGENVILYINLDELHLLEGDYQVKVSSKGISHWYNEFLKIDYFIGVSHYKE